MHLLIPNVLSYLAWRDWSRGELERMYYLLINFYLVSLPFILTTSLYESTCTRGYPYKLYLPHCSTDVRKYFVSQRIVKLWNELPANTDFSSIESFKRTLRGFNFNAYCDT